MTSYCRQPVPALNPRHPDAKYDIPWLTSEPCPAAWQCENAESLPLSTTLRHRRLKILPLSYFMRGTRRLTEWHLATAGRGLVMRDRSTARHAVRFPVCFIQSRTAQDSSVSITRCDGLVSHPCAFQTWCTSEELQYHTRLRPTPLLSTLTEAV